MVITSCKFRYCGYRFGELYILTATAVREFRVHVASLHQLCCIGGELDSISLQNVTFCSEVSTPANAYYHGPKLV